MSIYESIAKIQNDVDFIGKDKQVQSGGTYKYRGVDQVLNTLHPLFAKHKVFAVPEVLEIMEREIRKTAKGSEVLYQVLKVKYTFYAEDGTSVSAIVVGEAMDSGDKVSNKCMSVAYKYACFQILSIPTEETCADPDDSNEALSPQKKTPPKPNNSSAQQQKPQGEEHPFAPEDYTCAVCGKVIDKKLFDQTVKAYGTPLCSKECKAVIEKASALGLGNNK